MKDRAKKVRKIETITADFHEKHLKENKEYYEKEIERYRKALQDIVDHEWVISKVPTADKWLKEFVDIARIALHKKEST